MPPPVARVWTYDSVELELGSVIDELGRMPSKRELIRLGRRSLAGAIERRGGFTLWADRFGVAFRRRRTELRRLSEELAVDWLRSYGLHVTVERSRARYSLIVEGRPVAIKSARYRESERSSGQIVCGWVFHFVDPKHYCDSYILTCLSADDRLERWYVVPAKDISIRTLRILSTGKYDPYRNAIHYLSR